MTPAQVAEQAYTDVARSIWPAYKACLVLTAPADPQAHGHVRGRPRMRTLADLDSHQVALARLHADYQPAPWPPYLRHVHPNIK